MGGRNPHKVPAEMNVAWMTKAACRGFPTEWWFPERGERATKALFICEACPVREQCRQFALSDTALHGIWAGGTEAQRRSERRRRRKKERARPSQEGT